MGVITRRLYYTNVKGSIVFNDWCTVGTTLGTMIEPLNFNRFNADGTAFDPSDTESLITEMVEVDFNKLASLPPFTDSNGERLHIGALNPRTGF
jgi:hypothetical protein